MRGWVVVFFCSANVTHWRTQSGHSAAATMRVRIHDIHFEHTQSINRMACRAARCKRTDGIQTFRVCLTTMKSVHVGGKSVFGLNNGRQPTKKRARTHKKMDTRQKEAQTGHRGRSETDADRYVARDCDDGVGL